MSDDEKTWAEEERQMRQTPKRKPTGQREASVAKEIKRWLSTSQAGKVMGVSAQWVSHMARNGEIDAIQTSLGWLINPDSLQCLAAKRLEKAERQAALMRANREELYGDARTVKE